MKHTNLFSSREAYLEYRAAHTKLSHERALSFYDCLLYRAYMGKPICSAVAPNSNPYILAATFKRVCNTLRDKLIGVDDERRQLFLKVAQKHLGNIRMIQHQDLQAFDIALKIEHKALNVQEETSMI
jgi:hypothetical protein